MTKQQKKKFIDLKDRFKRGLAGTLALYMFLTSIMIFAPSWWNESYALTGGPSQPEVQSFEPIGTSDMVDLFSGDFTYNIPLLDVEGYPINIAYHSGVTMDQEASWVGLGWNINVGTINRALRGLPDDFDGDIVNTQTNLKVNRTIGMDVQLGDIELFGKKISGLSLALNLGVNYNNYQGIGSSFGIVPSLKFGSDLGFGGTASLGINSSSSGGLNISPSASLHLWGKTNKEGQTQGLSLSVGSSFNSRQGMTSLSIGANLTAKQEDFYIKDNGFIGSINKGNGSMGAAGSFDLMQPTYTPVINQSMNSYAVSGRLKTGVSFFGSDFGLAVGVNYSEQRLANMDRDKDVPSYGYFYSQNGQNLDDARMDFNRENQSSVTPSTPNLALTNYTYDMFSVSGQGVGGSYRPFRGQIGYVYNNTARNTSSSLPFTIETGIGTAAHMGGEIGVSIVSAKSGSWTDETNRFSGDNTVDEVLNFNNTNGNPDFENVILREANEMSVSSDDSYYTQFGGDDPVKLKLEDNGLFNVSVVPELEKGANGVDIGTIPDNYSDERIKRNNTIQDLTVAEVRSGFGVEPFAPLSFAQDPDISNYDNGHHIGQIVSLGTDGMRYIYGQPAYNKVQKEVTFSVGDKLDYTSYDGSGDRDVMYDKGLVEYSGDDNSLENEWGLDNYYQSVTTPGYAHSFLLTSIVSDDYVDVDNIPGPSDNDLGSYTKFNYKLHESDYEWRVPVEQNTATYNEGLKGDPTDDKANYIYGEKELWYLEEIETKNFIAKFELIDREDAFGVLDEDGGIDDTKAMQALKKISLYSKEDIRLYGVNAIPLKEVHFEYDYELCQELPNNSSNYDVNDEWDPNEDADKGGKLTLKKVYFTYRDSEKGKLSPYSFEYQNNEDYDIKAYDRWGCYKPNPLPDLTLPNNDPVTGAFDEPALPTFEYPYVDQDQELADDYTSAWTMSQVNLPSGGSIEMEYESDDYAYVQNEQAMNMTLIKKVEGSSGPEGVAYESIAISDNNNLNKRIYFDIDPAYDIEAYIPSSNQLYYRCLMEFDPADRNLVPPYDGRYDYVSGYAEISSYGEYSSSLGYIELEAVDFGDIDFSSSNDINPIALAGVQFGRLYLSKYVWDDPGFDMDQGALNQLAASFAQTFRNFVDGFRNPNKVIYDNGRGVNIVLDKSWIRLENPIKKKLGGGCRVASIRMNDNWSEMTDTQMNGFHYGQEYSYEVENKFVIDGVEYSEMISSGVASYEPQLGGDENPFKKPIFHSDEKKFAPDDRFYQEEPLGESFFPSASVGYSRVVVTNLARGVDANQNGIIEESEVNVTKTATGSVVHEFYTAKEFPTLVSKTELDPIRDKSNPFGLRSLLKIDVSDFYTGSQGFVVETNDMHGKPKAQSVYQEDQDEPITKVEYFYQSEQGTKPGTKELTNSVQTVAQDGTVQSNDIGVNFDLVADFQESKTRVYSAGAALNMEIIPFGIAVIPVPTVWPSFSSEKTMFRSATLTKVVQKFGVLENTKATDLGSVVETKNLAYDAETGQVLLTETTTNYDDKVYSMNIPAYWYYDNMGPAYQNIGFTIENEQLYSGVVNTPYADYFVEGDELMVYASNGAREEMWVVAVDKVLGKITLQDKYGNQPSFLADKIKISRSGRRNMQSQMMASVTTLSNPINTFGNNLYSNVLQASAIEFNDEWRTYCDCNGESMIASTNPYAIGNKGNYRPKVSYLHLSDRTQSDYNDNTNLREDGVFKSFTPYYRLNENGEWEVDRKDWTYTAEVTEFNPYGQELANEDALGRESAAQFGFNQTLAKAVAANAGYRDIGFSSFEDDNFSECADNHFQFEYAGNREVNDAHSGIYSIRVTSTNPVTLNRDLERCEQSECELELDVSISAGTNTFTVEPTGGAEPYNLNYSVINGNPVIQPTAIGPLVFTSGTFQIEFDVRDAAGCRSIEVVNVVNGNIVQ